jgi:hypothetical protein
MESEKSVLKAVSSGRSFGARRVLSSLRRMLLRSSCHSIRLASSASSGGRQ